MNGNVTKEGITADLEAMERVGIGGVEIFAISEGIPRGPVRFNSDEWRALVKFAVQEASRLGLEVCVHNCAGWSSSGGPWNTPEHGMQVVVSSEKTVTGPMHFEGTIPQPSSELGAYHDIAVMAFPVTGFEAEAANDPVPKITAGEPSEELREVKMDAPLVLPLPRPSQPQCVVLEFPRPVRERTLSITPGPGMAECQGEIEVSGDGQHYRKIGTLKLAFSRRDSNFCQSFGFKPVTARYFRVKFASIAASATHLNLAKVTVSPCAVIGNLRGKAFYNRDEGVGTGKDVQAAASEVVPREKIINLSKAMGADGKLVWDVPPGRWTILRTGYKPNGMRNHPAPKEGDGLECDKLSKEAVTAHWEGYMGKLIAEMGPLEGKTFNGVLIDSYEVGTQNWTPLFREEFQKRRGYDPVLYLPSLTGRIVDSPELTERFLWDFRRTIADLFAENYSGTFAELAHRNGMKFSVEPYGTCPSDDMQYGEYADIPMSEFWPVGVGSTDPGNAKLAASIGHVFGRKFIGAESFTATPKTSRWLQDPYLFKAQGDTVYCAGINRIIYHRYAHQPWVNRFPGMTMGPWGTQFERTLTWWEQGSAWLKYQARCQALLQSGLFVADACFYCGEGAPNSVKGAMPAGYDYDGCNTDALLHRMSVKDGRIVLPDGMSYRLLVLPPGNTMTPTVLGKLKELAQAGATIIGPRPVKSPSLSGYPACDQEVQRLAAELWDKGIIVDEPVEKALARLRLTPDFQCAAPAIRYIHRTVDGADVYFVANPTPSTVDFQALFRVSGKAPELWNPETGATAMAPVYTETEGRISVPLRLEPSGSIFVVFRHPAQADHAVTMCGPKVPTAASVADFSILKAKFGDLDRADKTTAEPRVIDVTEKLDGLVKSGSLNIQATTKVLGGDPAPGVEKTLRVDYRCNGVNHTIQVSERRTLSLPPEDDFNVPPPAGKLTRNTAGQFEVEAWQPGAFKVTTTSGKVLKAEVEDLAGPFNIDGPWTLRFPPHWGAPAQVTLPKLIPWTDSPDKGVKYFSGTATYSKELVIPSKLLGKAKSLYLDLGKVKNLARVRLNGTDLGILWKPPFRVDITGAARAGKNQLEIEVTNLWPNRLIGDEQLPEDRVWQANGALKEWPQWLLEGKPSPTGRYTFTTWHHWHKDDQPLESGILGPVILRSSVHTALW